MGLTTTAKVAAPSPATSKARKVRSPAYPFIPLKDAIDRARAFYQKEKLHPALVAHAAAHWNYKPKSSGALQTVGTLKQFGLLADEGAGEQRKVRITELARRILLDEREDSPERHRAIKEAALKPKLHAELWSTWGGDLPSNPSMKADLTLERGFSPGGADEFIRQFKATIAFAGLCESDSLPPTLEDTSEEEAETVDQLTTLLPPGGAIGKPTWKLPAGTVESEHFRVGPDSWVVVQFKGPVNQRAIKKLIRHYEENLDLYPDGEESAELLDRTGNPE